MQFQEAIKRSREESAKRLGHELERAVQSFVQQADTIVTERLTSVGQAAAQRLERRLSEADATVAARRDEVALALEQRLSAAQQELRQRLEELASDSEAERAVLEARMYDLQRRLDAALAHAQTLES
jgi:vacuolar-type H+-ATPase subunit E/Vma4